jgi:hypothetical protein
VQIGNKGTWSTAAVDVTPPVPHAGTDLFTENFDGYNGQTYFDNGVPVFQTLDLNAAHGWAGAQNSELGANGYGTIETTSGTGNEAFWLDTQNSPGPISISHEFTDATAAVAGTTSVLSFDIAKQSLDYQGTHYATDPNASFEFRVDGAMVAHINASQLATNDDMYHFEVPITGYANMGGNVHTLELVDTSGIASSTGFAVDSIHIHDWVV